MIYRACTAVTVAAFLVVFALPAAGAPFVFPPRVDDGFSHPGAPEVTAAAWLLYDEASDSVLASFSPEEERAMASTTKIMTGLLTLENAELSEIVTISSNAAETGEKEIGLLAGEQVTVEALFKALMIHSANDAAIAIAEHISGSVENFVDLMNERAVELGLTGTRFANPHGLDAPDHYSTARDLLELTLVAMSHPEFEDAVRARILVFPAAPDGTIRRGETTNLLLDDYPGNIGVKTGFTTEAQLTLVASTEREGRRLYVVLLGSEGTRAHFADARALFDYGFDELGIYGTLATGGAYESMKPRVQPGPLIASASAESLVHLAGQGLFSDIPVQPVVEAEPTAQPTIIIHRYTQPPPETLSEALEFWIRQLFSDG